MTSPQKPKHYNKQQSEDFRTRENDYTPIKRNIEYYTRENVREIIEKSKGRDTPLPLSKISAERLAGCWENEAGDIDRLDFAHKRIIYISEMFHYDRVPPTLRQLAAPLANLENALGKAAELLFLPPKILFSPPIDRPGADLEPIYFPPTLPPEIRRILNRHSTAGCTPEKAGLSFLALQKMVNDAYNEARNAPDQLGGERNPEFKVFMRNLAGLYADLFEAEPLVVSRGGPVVRFVLASIRLFPYEKIENIKAKAPVINGPDNKPILRPGCGKGYVYEALSIITKK